MYYSQKDPKWAKEKLGSGPDTIAQSGCKLSSFCNLGKEMEWFDYTPQSLNKLMIKEKLYTNGLLIADAVIAKYFGLTTERVKKDPSIVCIAETNYYANKGVPQHFFAYEKGMILDPLDADPKWKKNPYPIVSYRLFRQLIKKPTENTTSTTPIPVMGETTTTAIPVVPKPPETPLEAPKPPEVTIEPPKKEATLLERLIESIINWLKSIKERS